MRELSPEKLALAAELGADLGLLMGDEALVELGLGGPADVVFDFVGNDQSLDYAAATWRPAASCPSSGRAAAGTSSRFDRLPVEASLTTTQWGSIADLQGCRPPRQASAASSGTSSGCRSAEAAAAHDRLAEGKVSGRIVLVP